jgi:excisionase family DNA binding protein
MIAPVVLLSQEHGNREDEWLTVTQAAKLLGMSRWTITRRINEQELPAYQSKPGGGVYRIKRSDLDTYIQKARVHPPEP